VLPNERGNTGINEGLELNIIDCGKRQVEDVDGAGADGRKVAVEENEVEDAYGRSVFQS
jgi:hypothetical protein